MLHNHKVHTLFDRQLGTFVSKRFAHFHLYSGPLCTCAFCSTSSASAFPHVIFSPTLQSLPLLPLLRDAPLDRAIDVSSSDLHLFLCHSSSSCTSSCAGQNQMHASAARFGQPDACFAALNPIATTRLIIRLGSILMIISFRYYHFTCAWLVMTNKLETAGAAPSFLRCPVEVTTHTHLKQPHRSTLHSPILMHSSSVRTLFAHAATRHTYLSPDFLNKKGILKSA